MKHWKTLSMICVAGLTLAACKNQDDTQSTVDLDQVDESPSPTEHAQSKYLISNMADEKSLSEVRQAMLHSLPESDVSTVLGWVSDYNETIQQTSLLDGFKETEQPTYNVDKIDNLWLDKKGDFIGTNCRINTFSLLKHKLTLTSETDSNTDLFFMDHEAIEAEQLMTAEEQVVFDQLFSVVKTEDTKDPTVHAQKMTEHWKHFEFDDEATMLSVVFHDNLDGQELFVGHVGVLVPDDNGFLFFEKLSFQEPYQAVKFDTKDDAYTYLLDKYADSYGQETAQPFIMENDQLVKYVQQ